MPKNPYNTEYGRTAAFMNNYDGDLDDLLLDQDDFDNTDEYSSLESDKALKSADDYEFDPIADAATGAMPYDFDESSEELTEDSVDSFDAKVDQMVQKVAERMNPQRINAIVSGGDEFNVPPMGESVKSLSQYVKTIQESFDAYIARKIKKYSK